TLPLPPEEATLLLAGLIVLLQDWTLNVAVTLFATDIVTVQVELDPVQSPLQPANVEPESAVAVRVTDVLASKSPEHVSPQSIPEGVLATAPEPVTATVRVYCDGASHSQTG
ncbi:hypothetical protein MBAV_004222, partial [Candidatus Magnetobacterium bavaricum]